MDIKHEIYDVFKNGIYFKTTLIASLIICFLGYFRLIEWSTYIVISCTILSLMMVYISLKVIRVNCLKLFTSFFIVCCIVLFNMIPSVMWMYNSSERIDEVVPIEKKYKILYNDFNKVFVLLFDDDLQPLIIDLESEYVYDKLKFELEEKSISLEKKKIKRWYEEKTLIHYYLGEWEFK